MPPLCVLASLRTLAEPRDGEVTLPVRQGPVGGPREWGRSQPLLLKQSRPFCVPQRWPRAAAPLSVVVTRVWSAEGPDGECAGPGRRRRQRRGLQRAGQGPGRLGPSMGGASGQGQGFLQACCAGSCGPTRGRCGERGRVSVRAPGSTGRAQAARSASDSGKRGCVSVKAPGETGTRVRDGSGVHGEDPAARSARGPRSSVRCPRTPTGGVGRPVWMRARPSRAGASLTQEAAAREGLQANPGRGSAGAERRSHCVTFPWAAWSRWRWAFRTPLLQSGTAGSPVGSVLEAEQHLKQAFCTGRGEPGLQAERGAQLAGEPGPLGAPQGGPALATCGSSRRHVGDPASLQCGCRRRKEKVLDPSAVCLRALCLSILEVEDIQGVERFLDHERRLERASFPGLKGACQASTPEGTLETQGPRSVGSYTSGRNHF